MRERIEREQLIDADRHAVWEAITSDGWLGDQVELDLSPGGDARFRSDGEEREGWVEEALAPHRLAFWWARDGEPATRVELTLCAEDRMTRLRVVETRPLDALDLVGVPLRGTGGGARYGPALVAA